MTLVAQRYDEDADLTALVDHPENPRQGDKDAVSDSVTGNGFYGAILVQSSTGHILAGHTRRAVLLEQGTTRGPVLWVDCDNETARRILLADNRTAELAAWDEAGLLAVLQELEPDELPAVAFTVEDMEELQRRLDGDLGELSDDDEDGPREWWRPSGPYSRRTDTIQYEPTSETAPPVSALVDRSKADLLTARIAAADLPDEIKEFLSVAAQRHLVFDYSQIAEFYAHAEPELQALMEESALVIVDFDDAIRHGYVKLNERLTDLLAASRAEQEREHADA